MIPPYIMPDIASSTSMEHEAWLWNIKKHLHHKQQKSLLQCHLGYQKKLVNKENMKFVYFGW